MAQNKQDRQLSAAGYSEQIILSLFNVCSAASLYNNMEKKMTVNLVINSVILQL